MQMHTHRQTDRHNTCDSVCTNTVLILHCVWLHSGHFVVLPLLWHHAVTVNACTPTYYSYTILYACTVVRVPRVVMCPLSYPSK